MIMRMFFLALLSKQRHPWLVHFQAIPILISTKKPTTHLCGPSEASLSLWDVPEPEFPLCSGRLCFHLCSRASPPPSGRHHWPWSCLLPPPCLSVTSLALPGWATATGQTLSLGKRPISGGRQTWLLFQTLSPTWHVTWGRYSWLGHVL